MLKLNRYVPNDKIVIASKIENEEDVSMLLGNMIGNPEIKKLGIGKWIVFPGKIYASQAIIVDDDVFTEKYVLHKN